MCQIFVREAESGQYPSIPTSHEGHLHKIYQKLSKRSAFFRKFLYSGDMARPARRIEITEEEDAMLATLENDVSVHPKIRLRASILRDHRAGYSANYLAKRYNRNVQSIHNDLTRFQLHGLDGMADKAHSGRPVKISGEMQDFLVTALMENPSLAAPALAKMLQRTFQLKVTPETVRSHLYALGYSWQGERYVFGAWPFSHKTTKSTKNTEVVRKSDQKHHSELVEI